MKSTQKTSDSPKLDRRQFLEGLFGAAAVALAGPIPKALEALSVPEFKRVALEAANFIMPDSAGVEIWGDALGNYSFSPMPGFRSLRAESNRIASMVLTKFYDEWKEAPDGTELLTKSVRGLL